MKLLRVASFALAVHALVVDKRTSAGVSLAKHLADGRDLALRQYPSAEVVKINFLDPAWAGDMGSSSENLTLLTGEAPGERIEMLFSLKPQAQRPTAPAESGEPTMVRIEGTLTAWDAPALVDTRILMVTGMDSGEAIDISRIHLAPQDAIRAADFTPARTYVNGPVSIIAPHRRMQQEVIRMNDEFRMEDNGVVNSTWRCCFPLFKTPPRDQSVYYLELRNADLESAGAGAFWVGAQSGNTYLWHPAWFFS